MLTPMDIHNVEFKRTFKGYDPQEVDDFLATLVIKYETVYQENRRLQDELKKLRQEAEGKGHQEQDVLDLISLTKQTVNEVKTMAKQEANHVVSVAQAEAERIIAEARLRAQHLLVNAEDQLHKTQRLEQQLREKLRFSMETVWNLLNEESEAGQESTKLYREISPVKADKGSDPELTSK